MASVYKVNEQGNARMAVSATVPVGRHYQLVSVSCNYNAAPTSAEDFTIDLDANAGAVYDLRLYTLDPGTTSTSDILWQPDADLLLEGGDQIDVAYDNTDARQWAVQITMRAVG